MHSVVLLLVLLNAGFVPQTFGGYKPHAPQSVKLQYVCKPLQILSESPTTMATGQVITVYGCALDTLGTLQVKSDTVDWTTPVPFVLDSPTQLHFTFPLEVK